MSSQKYASPLRFNILPSRILLYAVCSLHLGAGALLIMLALPLLVKLTFAPIILASLVISLSQLRWSTVRLPFRKVWPALVEAVWDENDHWLLTDECQHIHRAVLLPTTYVHAQLVVINLRLENQTWYNRRRAIVLLRDNVDCETFRRLRIRLRWYSSQVPDKWAASG